MKTSLTNPRKWAPRGLFFKIFGWFLAAQLLIALALYVLAAATQRGFDQRFYEMTGSNLDYRVRAAAIAYENGGIAALRQAWRERPSPNDSPSDDPARRPPSGGGSSDDPARNDRLGSDPPRGDGPPPDSPWFDGPDGFGGPPDGRGRRQPGGRQPGGRQPGGRQPGGRQPGGRQNELDFSALYIVRGAAAHRYAERLAGPPLPAARFDLPTGVVEGQTTIFRPGAGRATFLLRRVDTARGSYLGVVRMRSDSGRPPGLFDGLLGGGPGPVTLWRPIVVALMMGALCFALARYLTEPAIKLRRATQQFAEGDFSARVGSQMGGRRDELADLGRDFDQMAERIENLMLAQRQLLGDISHELRSPLTRLSLALELAEQSADESTREYLTRIESEVGELNALIGQLLTITRLENMTPERSEGSSDAAYIDLSYLLEHVVHNADFEAGNRGGSVKITRNTPCQIVGNGELLHSAVENVVRNAILHSGPNPRVEVALQVENRDSRSYAVIRIRDYGLGVPEEALDQLFVPFYRVAQARDRQSGGTGLGLSITERAARFHGGTVRAKNAGDGTNKGVGGLEVEIALPLNSNELDSN